MAALSKLEEERQLALERQLIELTGSHDEREALAAAKEKEERIELLKRQIGRRIMNQGLVRGWSAWFELYEEKVYQRSRLASAANRMKSPALTAAFKHWLDDWHSAEQEKLKKASLSLEAELYRLRFNYGEIQLEKVRLTLRRCGAHSQAPATQTLRRGRTQPRVYASRPDDGTARASGPTAPCRTHCAQVAWVDERKALLERLRVVLEEQIPDQIHAKQEAEAALYEAEQRIEELIVQRDEASMNGPGVLAANKARDEALQEMRDQQERYKTQLERLLAEQRASFESELPARIGREGREAVEYLKKREGELGEVAAAAESRANELEERFNAKDAEVCKLKQQIAADKFKAVVKPAVRARKGILGGLDIDENSDVSVATQIGNALRDNGGRVLDLFREWDTDGDGEVTRKEFHAAMPKLGLEVSKEAIDALFSEWDADGGGVLNLKEMQKILKPTPRTSSQSRDRSESKGK